MSEVFDYDEEHDYDNDVESYTPLEQYAAGITSKRDDRWYAVEHNAAFFALLSSTWFRLEIELADLAPIVDLFPEEIID